MSDAKRRAAERRAVYGDAYGGAALLAERLRSGELPAWQVQLAAELSDPASLLVTTPQFCPAGGASSHAALRCGLASILRRPEAVGREDELSVPTPALAVQCAAVATIGACLAALEAVFEPIAREGQRLCPGRLSDESASLPATFLADLDRRARWTPRPPLEIQDDYYPTAEDINRVGWDVTDCYDGHGWEVSPPDPHVVLGFTNALADLRRLAAGAQTRSWVVAENLTNAHGHGNFLHGIDNAETAAALTVRTWRDAARFPRPRWAGRAASLVGRETPAAWVDEHARARLVRWLLEQAR